MTTKQLTAELSQAAGWLTTLDFPTMREHRSREGAIAAIERAVVLLAPSAARTTTLPEVDDEGDAAASEAYAQFQNLEEVKAAIAEGALSAETAYALEEAGRARKSYLAYFKSLMRDGE